ncbi:hypothetical protein TI39_contig852g00009 [Zymoseptoria brevis]|uniref:Uncharacterized protein n=1 Tax=Zymoseptoria brevis TaxID=1047168 RepID=A0A0F4GF26_9PEZI|nr:hypothetical protein TI39_contig852g00009 [Zymoseptoria brevis]
MSSKYSEIPDEDARNSGEEEHHPIIKRLTFLERSRRRLAPTPTCMLTVCVIVQTIVIILLSISALQQDPADDIKCQHKLAFEAAYGPQDLRFQSVAHEFDHLWEGMEGNSTTLDLEDPRLDGELMETSISMFHQLHCLSSMRHAIQMARDGKDPGLDYHDNGHWPHCLDYLHKTILCWADGTPERYPMNPDGSFIHFIDGTRDIRQCGDSRKLIEMMNDAGKQVGAKAFTGASAW